MMEPAVGVVVAGRYNLIRPLGKGGMASVWRALDRQRGCPVAMKFMRDEFASKEDARLRFAREAVAPQQIKSRYVVTITDHGVDGDTLYIVMELLEGEDLLKRLRREGRMTLAAAGKLLSQVAEGLQEAHMLGIIHRDLKPGNIFITKEGGEDIAKIVDFGIAKAKHTGCEEEEATQTGTILGSINYISPEQLKSSKDVDHRSDIWSLAVILLRLITGKMPFPGDNYADVVPLVCSGPIPVPSRLAPELNLPLELDEFFERALARDRTLRFNSAIEMAEQYNRLLIGLPGDPPSSTQPLGRSGPRAEDRAIALAEIERAAIRISGALRRATPDAEERQTKTVEVSDAEIIEAREAPTKVEGAVSRAGNARSRTEDDVTTVNSSVPALAEHSVAVDDEASTHLKIDVDLDSAILRAEEERRERDEEARDAPQKEDQAGAPELPAKNRSSARLTAGVLIVALVVAGVVFGWKFVANEDSGSSPGATPPHSEQKGARP